MKNLVKKLQAFLLLVAVSMMGLVFAQNITGKSVKISVDGTSPMHNWTMTSNSGTFSAAVNGNVINSIKFSTGAKNLKSTKGKMMDNKAYAALKADKTPTISFTATKMSIGKGIMNGKLTMAGVTKDIVVPVTVTKSGAYYNISGSSNIKMSDFGMERPGFMGVRTGDAVTVIVNIVAN